jgi:predicted transcriptional regulator
VSDLRRGEADGGGGVSENKHTIRIELSPDVVRRMEKVTKALDRHEAWSHRAIQRAIEKHARRLFGAHRRKQKAKKKTVAKTRRGSGQ